MCMSARAPSFRPFFAEFDAFINYFPPCHLFPFTPEKYIFFAADARRVGRGAVAVREAQAALTDPG